jgi:dephospho-CoA kinase
MYTIGLTGNIGCGKSTVLCMLQALGARVVDADKLAHQVMEPGTPVWYAIVDTFGQAILTPDGRIDRPALGRIVFSAPAALRRLEAIVHPAVREKIREQIEEATEPLVVIEAIKLVETGLHRLLNALWIVTCEREQQIERLVRKRGMSYETALQRIDAQAPIETKLHLAHVVIDNSGSIEATWWQVQAAIEAIFGAVSLDDLPPACVDEAQDDETHSALVVVSEG